jgi:hypothetical protein
LVVFGKSQKVFFLHLKADMSLFGVLNIFDSLFQSLVRV